MEILGPIALLLVGLALAFMGRKLIWLFIAAAGFILAYQLTMNFLSGIDPAIALIISLGVGAVAGYFATKFTNLLINIAGFILVGNAALTVVSLFGVTTGFWALLVFAIGGLIGLALIRWMLDYALIIISALGGAALVVDASEALDFIANTPILGTIIGVVVVVLGFIYQYRVYKTESAGVMFNCWEKVAAYYSYGDLSHLDRESISK